MMKLGKEKYITEEDLWALPRCASRRLRLRLMHPVRIKRTSSTRASRTPTAARPACGRLSPAPTVCPSSSRRSSRHSRMCVRSSKAPLTRQILAFAQPQLLRLLLAFVSSYDQQRPQPLERGYTIAVVMTICSVVQTGFLHQCASLWHVARADPARLCSLLRDGHAHARRSRWRPVLEGVAAQQLGAGGPRHRRHVRATLQRSSEIAAST